jgi:hypothetical protein
VYHPGKDEGKCLEDRVECKNMLSGALLTAKISIFLAGLVIVPFF